MRDDVVERSDRRVERAQIGVDKADVGEPERAAFRVRLRDVARAQVDADEAGVRVRLGERQQVGAGAAAEFEHAGVLSRRRRQTEEVRHRAQAIGVGGRHRIGRVGQRVVGGRDRRHLRLWFAGARHGASPLCVGYGISSTR